MHHKVEGVMEMENEPSKPLVPENCLKPLVSKLAVEAAMKPFKLKMETDTQKLTAFVCGGAMKVFDQTPLRMTASIGTACLLPVPCRHDVVDSKFLEVPYTANNRW